MTMRSRVAGAPRALMWRKSKAFWRSTEVGPMPHRDSAADPRATSTIPCNPNHPAHEWLDRVSALSWRLPLTHLHAAQQQEFG